MAANGCGSKDADVTRRPPRRAPCLTRHQQVTMRALFNVLVQDQPGTQLPVRDGRSPRGCLLDVLGLPIRRSRLGAAAYPTVTLEPTPSRRLGLPLQSFLPPSGRNGKAQRLAEICAVPQWPVSLVTPTGCCGSGSNCINRGRQWRRIPQPLAQQGCPRGRKRIEAVVHRLEAVPSVIHRFRRVRRSPA
jgi:hypothetical protein